MDKNHRFYKHGYNEHPLYRVWQKMKSRCYSKNAKCYSNYGGRGVYVCDEWKNNPKAFVEWGLANGWQKGLELDKDIIPKKSGIEALVYSPATCCFVTHSENNRHKRDNRIVEHNGKKQTVVEWSEELGIKRTALDGRLRRTGTLEKSKLPRKRIVGKIVHHDGRSQDLSGWAKEYGIRYKLLHERIQRGMSLSEALTTPKNHNIDNITFNGKVQNLSRWAKELNISQATLFNRLYHLNMAVEMAFTMPVQKHKRNKKFGNGLR